MSCKAGSSLTLATAVSTVLCAVAQCGLLQQGPRPWQVWQGTPSLQPAAQKRAFAIRGSYDTPDVADSAFEAQVGPGLWVLARASPTRSCLLPLVLLVCRSAGGDTPGAARRDSPPCLPDGASGSSSSVHAFQGFVRRSCLPLLQL